MPKGQAPFLLVTFAERWWNLPASFYIGIGILKLTIEYMFDIIIIQTNVR